MRSTDQQSSSSITTEQEVDGEQPTTLATHAYQRLAESQLSFGDTNQTQLYNGNNNVAKKAVTSGDESDDLR